MAALNIIIVEQSEAIRQQLERFITHDGAHHVSAMEHGAQLLQSDQLAQCDVLFLGLQLDASYPGFELIRLLQRTGRLETWTKVVFVTNTSAVVRANLPLLSSSAEILATPIEQAEVAQLLDIVQTYKRVLSPIMKMISSVPAAELLSASKELPAQYPYSDDLQLLKLKIALRLQRPDLVMTIASGLSKPVVRLLTTLHYSFVFGDQTRFEQALQDALRRKLLLKKVVFYRMFAKLMVSDLAATLSIYEQLPYSALDAAEISLKGQLVALTQSYDEGVDYLKEKLAVFEDDDFMRTTIVLGVMSASIQIMLAHQPDEPEFIHATLQLERYIARFEGKSERHNLASFVPFVEHLKRLLCGGEPPEAIADSMTELLKRQPSFEPMKWICGAICYAHCERTEECEQAIYASMQQMFKTEMSIEAMLYFLLFHALCDAYMTKAAMASMMHRLSTRALADNHLLFSFWMSYRAYCLAPENPKLLRAFAEHLKRCRLTSCWHVSLKQLIALAKAGEKPTKVAN